MIERDPRIGVDRPDSRGRTGLDQVGRDLACNPAVIVRDVEVTSDGWHVLRRTTFDYRRRDGRWETQQRETYDRGKGATILLYDTDRRTAVLGRYPRTVRRGVQTGNPQRMRWPAGRRQGRDRASAGRQIKATASNPSPRHARPGRVRVLDE